jgi:poly-beta-1,6-N-acetyl-D-glucosamine synthase
MTEAPMEMEILFWTCAALIAFTHLGYYLVLLGVARFRSKKRMADPRHTPSVTMVIAAYNEEKVILQKLRNCLALRYPEDHIEFLVGSDHSTDRTDPLAAGVSATHPRIRLYSFEKREGKAAVINKVVPEARGEILVFSDANTMYDPEAIRKLVAPFADPSIGGVCGRLVLIQPNSDIGGKGEAAYWNYENRIKCLEGRIRTVFGATGGIYAIRKSLFQPLPLSRTNLSDDFLIPLKVVASGYDVVFEGDALATENASSSLKDEFRRKVRIGSANCFAVRQIASLLNPAKGFVAFGLWSHKIIRWAVPFLLIGLFAASAALFSRPPYAILFWLQAGFYGCALLGWALADRPKMHGPWMLPFYFVAVNLALLIGYLRYANRSVRPTWTRLER